MATKVNSLAEEGELAKQSIRRRPNFTRAFLRQRLAAIGAVLLVVLILVAVFGPLLSPYSPYRLSPVDKYESLSLRHPMGTDFFGRDVLTRLMYGLRTSLAIAVLVESIGLVFGVTIGLLSGYLGGGVDMVLMRITDAFLAFPSLLFALAIMSVRGEGFVNLVIALALQGWTGYARLTRAEGLKIRHLEYIEAARVTGASNRLILVRHVLPNSIGTIIVYATLALPIPILAAAALSFLGLGLPVNTASLGNMINVDHGYMRYAWWATTFPGLAIAAIVLAFNFLGDGLRDALDPRLQA